MVGRLRVGRLLAGYRGRSYDVEALARVVADLSQVVAASPWLNAVDLNPVMVHPGIGGATVVDAALVCRDDGDGATSP
jgi:hypothetical protein